MQRGALVGNWFIRRLERGNNKNKVVQSVANLHSQRPKMGYEGGGWGTWKPLGSGQQMKKT